MKCKMFVLALATAAGTAVAQNSIVSNVPGTYVDISGLAGAINLVGADTDDGSFSFTSSVNNTVFISNTVFVSSNGVAQWGGAFGSTAYTNAAINPGTTSPTTPNDSQAIFAYWDDQYVRPAASGGGIYWIEGPAASFGLPAAAGNVLIIQWSNIDHYFDSPETGNYQIQVFQNPLGGTVAAQILYNDVVFGDAANYDNGVSATIGYAAGTTGGPGSTGNAPYSYNTASAVTSGTVLSLQLSTAPTPPTGVGSVSPPSVSPGDSVVFAVSTIPGANPTSTGINVHGDLTSIGGGANVVFHDDGLAGDAAAGDGTFSYSYAIPSGTAGGTYTVSITTADAQSRSSTSSIVGKVFNPEDLGQIGAGAGGTEVVTTHDVTVNAAGEVQWFKFSIGADVLQGSTNYMDIDTEPTADDGTPAVGSINDTELGLYTTDGTLLADDDDSGSNYHTQLSFGDNTNFRPAFGNGVPGDGRDGDLATGTYYLAGGLFNVTFAAGFNVVCTSATGAGVYQINFRTNIPGGGTGNPCGPADIGSTGGVAGADNHLDNNDFIVYIDNFFNHLPSADIGTTGGVPGSDGAWDNNDFIVFIDQFFNAPASCR